MRPLRLLAAVLVFASLAACSPDLISGPETVSNCPGHPMGSGC